MPLESGTSICTPQKGRLTHSYYTLKKNTSQTVQQGESKDRLFPMAKMMDLSESPNSSFF
jgi:hypothetical protein